MFGWDWPTLTLERLVDDWRTLGYAEDVYEDFSPQRRGFLPARLQSEGFDGRHCIAGRRLREIAASEHVEPESLALLCQTRRALRVPTRTPRLVRKSR
jgi:hypothetical protein